MNRYLLFAGYTYYPRQGWGDFVDSYETREEAEAFGQSLVSDQGNDDWYHVVDFNIGSKVADGRRSDA